MNIHAVCGRLGIERQIPGSRSGSAAAALLLMAVLPFAGGCSSFLKAEPDTSRYFVLSSTQAAPTPSLERPDIHFGIGPIQMPGYLETQNIVRAGAGGSIDYLPNSFWGESLSDAFARALLHRTAARIGTSHAVAFPWYSTTKVDWKVPVDVLRFEATTDGRAVLVARWSVERVADGRVVGSRQSVLEETAGSDPALVVDALNRCVDRLADAIAAGITGAAPSTKATGTR